MANSGSDHEQDESIDFDDVMHATGYFGRYHLLQAFLQMGCGFAVAFPLLSIVFIGYEVPHTCSELDTTTTGLMQDMDINNYTEFTYETCHIQVKNNVSGILQTDVIPCVAGHNYSMAKDVSLVSEWDLVCDRAGLAELSQTLMMLGQGVGGFVSTTLADRYGRKPLYCISLLGLWATCLGVAFSPNVIVYIVLRFLIGGFQQGVSLTAFTLFVEMLTTAHRHMAGTIGGFVWSGSVMVLAPLAYLMKDSKWSYFQITTSCVALYVFILPWTLDESVRWLIANNKYKSAKKVIRKAARMNGSDVNKVVEVLEGFIAAENQIMSAKFSEDDVKSQSAEANNAPLINGNGVIKEDDNNAADKQYTVLDIFRYKHIFITSLITWYIWTVNSLTYYGLFLTSTSLTGNRFLNFFLYALVEIPSTISVYLALKRFGRRHVSMIFHGIAGVALIISVIIITTGGDTVAGGTAATIFNLVGKYAITGSFNCLFIYIPELYPTNLRTAGLGMASAISRIGGMSAPFSRQLVDLVKWGPGVLFGVACLVATFLIRYLPETRGTELPTTIEECNEMFKHSKKTNKTANN